MKTIKWMIMLLILFIPQILFVLWITFLAGQLKGMWQNIGMTLIMMFIIISLTHYCTLFSKWFDSKLK
jgi:hypothetical protein